MSSSIAASRLRSVLRRCLLRGAKKAVPVCVIGGLFVWTSYYFWTVGEGIENHENLLREARQAIHDGRHHHDDGKHHHYDGKHHYERDESRTDKSKTTSKEDDHHEAENENTGNMENQDTGNSNAERGTEKESSIILEKKNVHSVQFTHDQEEHENSPHVDLNSRPTQENDDHKKHGIVADEQNSKYLRGSLSKSQAVMNSAGSSEKFSEKRSKAGAENESTKPEQNAEKEEFANINEEMKPEKPVIAAQTSSPVKTSEAVRSSANRSKDDPWKLDLERFLKSDDVYDQKAGISVLTQLGNAAVVEYLPLIRENVFRRPADHSNLPDYKIQATATLILDILTDKASLVELLDDFEFRIEALATRRIIELGYLDVGLNLLMNSENPDMRVIGCEIVAILLYHNVEKRREIFTEILETEEDEIVLEALLLGSVDWESDRLESDQASPSTKDGGSERDSYPLLKSMFTLSSSKNNVLKNWSTGNHLMTESELQEAEEKSHKILPIKLTEGNQKGDWHLPFMIGTLGSSLGIPDFSVISVPQLNSICLKRYDACAATLLGGMSIHRNLFLELIDTVTMTREELNTKLTEKYAQQHKKGVQQSGQQQSTFPEFFKKLADYTLELSEMINDPTLIHLVLEGLARPYMVSPAFSADGPNDPNLLSASIPKLKTTLERFVNRYILQKPMPNSVKELACSVMGSWVRQDTVSLSKENFSESGETKIGETKSKILGILVEKVGLFGFFDSMKGGGIKRALSKCAAYFGETIVRKFPAVLVKRTETSAGTHPVLLLMNLGTWDLVGGTRAIRDMLPFLSHLIEEPMKDIANHAMRLLATISLSPNQKSELISKHPAFACETLDTFAGKEAVVTTTNRRLLLEGPTTEMSSDSEEHRGNGRRRLNAIPKKGRPVVVPRGKGGGKSILKSGQQTAASKAGNQKGGHEMHPIAASSFAELGRDNWSQAEINGFIGRALHAELSCMNGISRASEKYEHLSGRFQGYLTNTAVTGGSMVSSGGHSTTNDNSEIIHGDANDHFDQPFHISFLTVAVRRLIQHFRRSRKESNTGVEGNAERSDLLEVITREMQENPLLGKWWTTVGAASLSTIPNSHNKKNILTSPGTPVGSSLNVLDLLVNVIENLRDKIPSHTSAHDTRPISDHHTGFLQTMKSICLDKDATSSFSDTVRGSICLALVNIGFPEIPTDYANYDVGVRKILVPIDPLFILSFEGHQDIQLEAVKLLKVLIYEGMSGNLDRRLFKNSDTQSSDKADNADDTSENTNSLFAPLQSTFLLKSTAGQVKSIKETGEKIRATLLSGVNSGSTVSRGDGYLRGFFNKDKVSTGSSLISSPEQLGLSQDVAKILEDVLLVCVYKDFDSANVNMNSEGKVVESTESGKENIALKDEIRRICHDILIRTAETDEKKETLRKIKEESQSDKIAATLRKHDCQETGEMIVGDSGSAGNDFLKSASMSSIAILDQVSVRVLEKSHVIPDEEGGNKEALFDSDKKLFLNILDDFVPSSAERVTESNNHDDLLIPGTFTKAIAIEEAARRSKSNDLQHVLASNDQNVKFLVQNLESICSGNPTARKVAALASFRNLDSDLSKFRDVYMLGKRDRNGEMLGFSDSARFKPDIGGMKRNWDLFVFVAEAVVVNRMLLKQTNVMQKDEGQQDSPIKELSLSDTSQGRNNPPRELSVPIPKAPDLQNPVITLLQDYVLTQLTVILSGRLPGGFLERSFQDVERGFFGDRRDEHDQDNFRIDPILLADNEETIMATEILFSLKALKLLMKPELSSADNQYRDSIIVSENAGDTLESSGAGSTTSDTSATASRNSRSPDFSFSNTGLSPKKPTDQFIADLSNLFAEKCGDMSTVLQLGIVNFLETIAPLNLASLMSSSRVLNALKPTMLSPGDSNQKKTILGLMKVSLWRGLQRVGDFGDWLSAKGFRDKLERLDLLYTEREDNELEEEKKCDPEDITEDILRQRALEYLEMREILAFIGTSKQTIPKSPKNDAKHDAKIAAIADDVNDSTMSDILNLTFENLVDNLQSKSHDRFVFSLELVAKKTDEEKGMEEEVRKNGGKIKGSLKMKRCYVHSEDVETRFNGNMTNKDALKKMMDSIARLRIFAARILLVKRFKMRESIHNLIGTTSRKEYGGDSSSSDYKDDYKDDRMTALLDATQYFDNFEAENYLTRPFLLPWIQQKGHPTEVTHKHLLDLLTVMVMRNGGADNDDQTTNTASGTASNGNIDAAGPRGRILPSLIEGPQLKNELVMQIRGKFLKCDSIAMQQQACSIISKLGYEKDILPILHEAEDENVYYHCVTEMAHYSGQQPNSKREIANKDTAKRLIDLLGPNHRLQTQQSGAHGLIALGMQSPTIAGRFAGEVANVTFAHTDPWVRSWGWRAVGEMVLSDAKQVAVIADFLIGSYAFWQTARGKNEAAVSAARALVKTSFYHPNLVQQTVKDRNWVNTIARNLIDNIQQPKPVRVVGALLLGRLRYDVLIKDVDKDVRGAAILGNTWGIISSSAEKQNESMHPISGTLLDSKVEGSGMVRGLAAWNIGKYGCSDGGNEVESVLSRCLLQLLQFLRNELDDKARLGGLRGIVEIYERTKDNVFEKRLEKFLKAYLLAVGNPRIPGTQELRDLVDNAL